MKHWIPFFQSLVWPLVFLGLLIWFRKSVKIVLSAIATRLGSGAAFEVGLKGIKIGGVQAPPSTAMALVPEPATREIEGLPHSIYMTHEAVRDRSLDKDGTEYYRLRIALEADEAALLDEVEKVTYHLHPTFKNPDRTATERSSNFEIGTAAWGDFNMTAEVFFKNNKPKLVIERYINFPGNWRS
jgi:hypothetical protein